MPKNSSNTLSNLAQDEEVLTIARDAAEKVILHDKDLSQSTIDDRAIFFSIVRCFPIYNHFVLDRAES
jgi:hypothetical protein